MLMMTDEETRDAAAVMRYAENDGEWPTWHPNDGTQYRVKVVRCIGGPGHGDQMLLVAVTGQWRTVRYTPLSIGADYRAVPWNATRFKRERLNPPGDYDWWPKVISPLLKVATVVSSR